MFIIGITGTLGAGKGTIVKYLVEQKGYSHFSVRAYLTEEIKRQHLPVNRDSMVVIANNLRAKHTPSFIIDELYKQAKKTGHNCVIESIRTPGEIESLKSKGSFYLFAIDATAEIRYDRVTQRNSETDQITFETFLDNEKREMTSNDPNKQNLQQCINKANFVFNNNSTIEDLYIEVEETLKKLK